MEPCWIFYFNIKRPDLAEKTYRKFYEALLKSQQLDARRYHKGLPLHNLGLSIELQGDIPRAIDYYEAAYIEDVISSDKASIGAPAYRNLRYRLRIDEKELIGIYAIAKREPADDPIAILEKFKKDKPKWISIGLAIEYFVLDKNYLGILLHRVKTTRMRMKSCVERFFVWLKSFRRITVRYERLKITFTALIQIACILIRLRFCNESLDKFFKDVYCVHMCSIKERYKIRGFKKDV